MLKVKPLNIGLCVITTRKYKQFFPQLLEGIKKYFVPDHSVTVFLFTDETGNYFESDGRVKVEQHLIPALAWPYATLYRYKVFHQHADHLSKMDYLFYSDADMSFVDVVGNEIMGEGLTVTYHPGFYAKRDIVGHWGSNGVVRESLAWIPEYKRKGYVAGGFNGATADEFLKMSRLLDDLISQDERKGIIAEHNDESFLNAYVKHYPGIPTKYLSPEYCCVEQIHLRHAWGIGDIHPRLIALSKNHKEIRS
jgi:Glycosyltransferase family 6